MAVSYWLLPDGSLRTRKWPAILGHPRGWIRLRHNGDLEAELESVRRALKKLRDENRDLHDKLDGERWSNVDMLNMAYSQKDFLEGQLVAAQREVKQTQRDLVTAQQLATSTLQLMREQLQMPAAFGPLQSGLLGTKPPSDFELTDRLAEDLARDPDTGESVYHELAHGQRYLHRSVATRLIHLGWTNPNYATTTKGVQ